MKKVWIAMSALALYSGAAFSQSEVDAFRYAQTDLNGTARYLAMGGAFGALGGDISAMSTNPAGLAIYRSSEVVTTVSLSNISAKTNWLGTKEDNTRRKLSFDNIAYVGYFPTGNDEGIVGWNVGFSYNRVKNFRRNYSMSAGGAANSSLSDYVALRATLGGLLPNELKKSTGYDPYAVTGDWLSVLGYNAGYIDAIPENSSDYYSAFMDADGVNYAMTDNRLQVCERGAIDQYNISAAINISNVAMLGATVVITDLNYDYASYYTEDFEFGDYLTLGEPNGANWLRTDGTGYGFNVGAIVRPSDYFRFGVAYNSPVWYKMTDNYEATASSEINKDLWTASTPYGAYTNYEFRSPDKWLFSIAGIFGRTALLSVDYEMANYHHMRLYDEYGSGNQEHNGYIKEDFGAGHTVRVGAEVKVTPQFSLRAGYVWSGSPVKSALKNNEVEVMTVGTIPNYTIDKGITNYTFGIGYRFTPHFYTDLACVIKVHKEDVYAFSSIFNDEHEAILKAESASMKTNTTRVALTLGYKF